MSPQPICPGDTVYLAHNTNLGPVPVCAVHGDEVVVDTGGPCQIGYFRSAVLTSQEAVVVLEHRRQVRASFERAHLESLVSKSSYLKRAR